MNIFDKLSELTPVIFPEFYTVNDKSGNEFVLLKNGELIDNLEKTIDDEGMLVKKEYVKGRKNLYTNPAITEYNRTTQIANNTVATLLKIIRNRKDDSSNNDDTDPLFEAINGVGVDE